MSRLGKPVSGGEFSVSVAALKGVSCRSFVRRGLAVLTIAALASFSGVHAQGDAVPGRSSADSTAWTLADGVVTLTGDASRDNPLYTRAALADSVSSLEFRAPKGAQRQSLCPGPLRRRAQWHGRLAERGDPVPRAALRRGLQQARQRADARSARRRRRTPQRGLRKAQRGCASGTPRTSAAPSSSTCARAPFALRNAQLPARGFLAAHACPRLPAARPTRRTWSIPSRSARKPFTRWAARPATWSSPAAPR